MDSLHFHIKNAVKSIRKNDCNGAIRNSEIIVELMDRIELRPTLDQIENCISQLEGIGNTSSVDTEIKKKEITAKLEELLGTLPSS